MILFFSGTGNSRYAARLTAMVTGDETVSMNEMIKKDRAETLRSDKPFVFAAPTYAWRIPRVVEDLLLKTKFEGSRKAYFILTCGDSTGNAGKYLKKLCAEKGFEYMGLASVIMPENYIAMFNAPGKPEAERIIKNARQYILKAAEHIKNGTPLPEERSSFAGRLQSGAINPLFYAAAVSARGFRSTDKCISCGKCEKLCPLNNIVLKDGRPQWGRRCTHCMACICGCPEEAIEYKNATKGKPRYYLTDD